MKSINTQDEERNLVKFPFLIRRKEFLFVHSVLPRNPLKMMSRKSCRFLTGTSRRCGQTESRNDPNVGENISA